MNTSHHQQNSAVLYIACVVFAVSAAVLRAQVSIAPTLQLKDVLADYSTKGHPKAKGIDMRIGYPKPWKAEEGDRPNVVQKFVSPNGYAAGSLVITIANLPDEVSDDDIKAMFSGDGPSEILPEGARQLSRRHTKIEQLDADIVSYIFSAERAGMHLTLFSHTLVFAINRKLVVVNMSCSAAGDSIDESALIKRGAQLDQLFKICINRIVLASRWSL